MYECHFYIPDAGNLPGIVRFYPLIVNVNSHDTIKRTKKTGKFDRFNDERILFNIYLTQKEVELNARLNSIHA